jgi:hypothetical protein
MLVASLLQQRHMPFFAIVVSPYLVSRLSKTIDDLGARFPSMHLTRVSANMITVFLGFLIALQLFAGGRRYVAPCFRIIVDPDTYPVSAVQFIKMSGLEGNLLVPFDWGEYAIWKLHPTCRVSIDGRFRTVYPESVIQDHFIAKEDSARWQALVDKYPSDLLLVRQLPFFQALIKAGGPWVYVYSDPIAIVFVKDGERNREALARLKAGQMERPDVPSVYFP